MFFVICFSIQGPLSRSANSVTIKKNELQPVLQNSPNFIVKLPRYSQNILQNVSHSILFASNDYITATINEFPNEIIRNEALFLSEDYPSKMNKLQYRDEMWPISFNLYNIGPYGGLKNEDLNIKPVWERNIKGNNVTLAIGDDGCYTEHEEFKGRFISKLNLDITTKTQNVEPRDDYDSHGTPCLSMAAAGMNNVCSIGSAPEVRIACHRFESSELTVSGFITSLTSSLNDIDIISYSWALNCDIGTSKRCYFYQHHQIIDDAFEKVVTQGRNGKGRIVLFAGGNEGHYGSNSNSYLLNSDRHVISVSASTFKGSAAYYTAPGSNILVNSPSGGEGSYVTGADDIPFVPAASIEGSHSCASMWTGTSAAAPQIAGIVALMLQENNDLSWRDVQLILALTATRNGPKSYHWHKNGAGYYYSHYHGFGRVNADLAVSTSKVWKNLPSEKKFSKKFAEKITSNKYKGKPVNVSIDCEDAIKFIESITVTFTEPNTKDISLLRISLISPSGTVSNFKPLSSTVSNVSPQLEYSFTIRDYLGESSKGTWTMRIQNDDILQNFTLINLTMNFFGCEAKPDIPNIQRQTGAEEFDSRPTENLTVQTTAPEFMCGDNVTVIFNKTDDYETYNFPKANGIERYRMFFGRTPALAIDDPEEIVSFSIPCVFDEVENDTMTLTRYKRPYNAIFESKIYHKRTSQSSFVKYPRSNDVFHPNDSFVLEYETWIPHKLVESSWESKLIFRLINTETNEEIYREPANNLWNNGFINITIGDILCSKCLISITPVAGRVCDSFVLPVKIIGEKDAIPDDFAFDSGECIDDGFQWTSGDKPEPTPKNVLFDMKSILLISLTSAFVLITIIVLIVYCVRRRKSAEQSAEQQSAAISSALV